MWQLFCHIWWFLYFFSHIWRFHSHIVQFQYHMWQYFCHIWWFPNFFLIFDGFILTLCSTNITCDCTFVTFGGSFFFSHIWQFNPHIVHRDGNGAGRGRWMESSSPPRMVLSCSIPAPPRMTGKTFSLHPRPLGPREALSHPVKLYFLLIFPTTRTIFLMKPISLIKIYLKLQLILSHQMKSIFRKKLNTISKCLTRQS